MSYSANNYELNHMLVKQGYCASNLPSLRPTFYGLSLWQNFFPGQGNTEQTTHEYMDSDWLEDLISAPYVLLFLFDFVNVKLNGTARILPSTCQLAQIVVMKPSLST
jgi:hypothetical protein